MNIDSFIAELEDALGDHAKGRLTPGAKLREFSWWDSLSLLTTMTVFDSYFGTQISDREITSRDTVEAIFELGLSRRKSLEK